MIDFKKHEPKLKSQAFRFTKNEDDAKDLIQDTFMKALQNLDKFDGSNASGWLYTIMRNLFITDYNRKKKVKFENDDFLLNSRSCENLGVCELGVKEIEHALKFVPEKFSTPFVMYVRGYKYEEISEELGVELGTIKNRIHVARLMLKGRLRRW